MSRLPQTGTQSIWGFKLADGLFHKAQCKSANGAFISSYFLVCISYISFANSSWMFMINMNCFSGFSDVT